jgi:acyl-CoA reductase-like NAD-dependent aldehyde dehydrogenase
VLAGGRRAAAGRNFYEPTVLVDVNPGMRVMREESFGPVLPIMRCAGEDEAVRLANDTRYGLLASVYCGDQAHGRRVAERIDAGTVIVNDALVTHAYPETPWQGIKESGFGRVHSDDGLRDLCLGLHVNHEVLSVASPTWYPYTKEKLSRLLTLTDLAHADQTLGEKLHALGDLVRGRRG